MPFNNCGTLKLRASLIRLMVTRDATLSALLSATKYRQAEGHNAGGRSQRDAARGAQVEAVENHMPEVVIVDEIGTEAEALACRSIAERGVQLIGTAHGQILENLMKNPTLSDLIGGIQSVTLGAQPAMDCQVQMGRGTSHVMQKLVSALAGNSWLFCWAFCMQPDLQLPALDCPCCNSLASPCCERRR